MDGKAIAAHNYLEHMLLDETVKPTMLPLSLLEAITNDFSGDREIGRGGFAVVYKVWATLNLPTQSRLLLWETQLRADKRSHNCREC